MRILVTGGAALNESVVIYQTICNSSDSVVNLDKLIYTGNLELLTAVNNSERYVFEQSSILDHTDLERVLRVHEPDAVMYLSAKAPSTVRLCSSRTTSSYVYE